MFADRRRLLIGGGLVVVLALGVWTLTGSTPAATVATRARARARQDVPEAGVGTMKPLRLEALTAERGEPSGTARNPFRFQPKAAPPPPPRVMAPPVAEVTPPFVSAAPAGPPPPPPIPLKFIALVERADGVKWAVLSDGKVTMYGKDGDSIDGRYRIQKVGVESVEITYLDGRGRQVIRLTGQ